MLGSRVIKTELPPQIAHSPVGEPAKVIKVFDAVRKGIHRRFRSTEERQLTQSGERNMFPEQEPYNLSLK